jgi:hypothetical protein
MAKLNNRIKRPRATTATGVKVVVPNSAEQLRRIVLACMLWEDEFYVDGQSTANHIATLIPNVPAEEVAQLAIDARTKYNLRHVSLLLVREMARNSTHRHLVADTLSQVIQRADELTEFLAIYWKDGRCPVSAQVKKGLAAAFGKFDEYQLAKYDRKGEIKLRDVLRICHPRPVNREQDDLWNRLLNGTLKAPDTWERNLSGGEDKKETFTRMLKANLDPKQKNLLGGLALIRNLRNMEQVGVDKRLVRRAIKEMNASRVLPFRFIAAAKHAPQYEPELETAMLKCLGTMEKLPGKTVLLVDVSGSMGSAISGNSDMNRFDAACGVAQLARELCEDVSIYTFSNKTVLVPPRRGFALSDAILSSQYHNCTYLRKAIEYVNSRIQYDRIIVFTDEQSHDGIGSPLKGTKAYINNVASNKYGVGYLSEWTHVTGFSEAVIDFIREIEK